MLFAGLPGPQKLDQARRDVFGQDVTYEQFLIYDHDVWRFLWDGHVLAMGENPYSATPEEWHSLYESGAPEASKLFQDPRWEDIYDFIGYKDYTSVYPPAAQLFFLLSHGVSPGSVFIFKASILLTDMLVCWLLILLLRIVKQPSSAVILYAWNPLVIKEFVGSAHFDPLMMSFLLLAVWAAMKSRHRLSGFALGLAILTKLIPVILIPFFFKRGRERLMLGLCLALVPSVLLFGGSLFWWAEGMRVFGSEWVFNPGPRGLIHHLVLWATLPKWMETAAVISILSCVIVLCWIRDTGTHQSLVTSCYWVLGVALLLSAAVMPWYVPWLLIFSLFTGHRSWVVFSALVLGTYHIYIGQTMHTWWLWVSYGLFLTWFTPETARFLLGRYKKEFCGNKLC